MIVSGNHNKTPAFHLIHSPQQPVILVYPWLRRHNPYIDWASGTILQWSALCHAVCLRPVSSLAPSRVVPSDSTDISQVPKEYHDLKGIFSKILATSLPPHHPYDCAIDLLPGTTHPRGRLFSLSAPETNSMKRYINDSLAAGLMRPSSYLRELGFSSSVRTRPCGRV